VLIRGTVEDYGVHRWMNLVSTRVAARQPTEGRFAEVIKNKRECVFPKFLCNGFIQLAVYTDLAVQITPSLVAGVI